MGKKQHRRSVSMKPHIYVLLTKLAELGTTARAEWLEAIIEREAAAAGITAEDAEVERLKACRVPAREAREWKQFEHARNQIGKAFA